MSHIREIPESEATGLLRKLYGEARDRAGRIWNIVRVMSLNPRVMQTTMGVLPNAHVRVFAAEPMAPRDARRGHLQGERLLLLRAGARA